jgi:hypothetical protein
VLSTAIATTGVIGDSTATVIGAMIIVPLAIPIQGAAVAIAYGELRPLLLSVAVVAAAMAVVVALAALMAVVLPELHLAGQNSQITGRASPTLVDLVAAAATGLAGSFAVGRRVHRGHPARGGHRHLRFEGETLVVIVEGADGGADDGELTQRLRGAVPSGTPVVVNPVAGGAPRSAALRGERPRSREPPTRHGAPRYPVNRGRATTSRARVMLRAAAAGPHGAPSRRSRPAGARASSGDRVAVGRKSTADAPSPFRGRPGKSPSAGEGE